MGFVTFDSRAGAEAAKNALNVSTQSSGGCRAGATRLAGPRVGAETGQGSYQCALDCGSEMVLQHPTREPGELFKADIILGKWMQTVSV